MCQSGLVEATWPTCELSVLEMNFWEGRHTLYSEAESLGFKKADKSPKPYFFKKYLEDVLASIWS